MLKSSWLVSTRGWQLRQSPVKTALFIEIQIFEQKQRADAPSTDNDWLRSIVTQHTAVLYSVSMAAGLQ